MKAGDEVVCETLQDGEVITYEPSSFDAEDAARFIDLWGPMEDRNFFVATLTLVAS